MFVNREWQHPEGYKLVNNQILRTTAKEGKAIPRPPGKLALQNAQTLAPAARVPGQADEAHAAAERAAEVRRKNLTPTAAPQTGTHL